MSVADTKSAMSQVPFRERTTRSEPHAETQHSATKKRARGFMSVPPALSMFMGSLIFGRPASQQQVRVLGLRRVLPRSSQ